MTRSRSSTVTTVAATASIFGRILIGVDGSASSFDACRQAARLAEPDAFVEAAVVSLFPPAAAVALGVEHLADSLEQDAGSVLLAAQRILGPHAELRRLDGLTVEALLAEVKRVRATLLAIGTHGHARLREIVLGGVAGELLHQAPCAVLVARPVPDTSTFPREIVVGLDGSDEAEQALDVARGLATRRGATLRIVVALGGKRVDVARLGRRHPSIETSAATSVRALVDAASSADLLVVGSRGVHGPRALGSVSERVAHQAPCSVLVTRGRTSPSATGTEEA